MKTKLQQLAALVALTMAGTASAAITQLTEGSTNGDLAIGGILGAADTHWYFQVDENPAELNQKDLPVTEDQWVIDANSATYTNQLQQHVPILVGNGIAFTRTPIKVPSITTYDATGATINLLSNGTTQVTRPVLLDGRESTTLRLDLDIDGYAAASYGFYQDQSGYISFGTYGAINRTFSPAMVAAFGSMQFGTPEAEKSVKYAKNGLIGATAANSFGDYYCGSVQNLSCAKTNSMRAAVSGNDLTGLLRNKDEYIGESHRSQGYGVGFEVSGMTFINSVAAPAVGEWAATLPITITYS
ncbi:hypothetical protein ACPV36_12345 [Photobacterium damselae]|uniref:F4 family fimbrial subunit n=1 Tax=Photobacterium damselae TaxID=38293 RepID=UPI0040684D00